MKLRFVSALLSSILLYGGTGIGASTACNMTMPKDFTGVPVQWLGACPAGHAEGLGVIRAGRAEPYRFFAGEARGGRPLRGLIVVDGGFYAAAAFDARGTRQDVTSGDPNEFHALFVLATRAALATAQRFAAAGNRGSAAYYQRLAKQIRDGEPE